MILSNRRARPPLFPRLAPLQPVSKFPHEQERDVDEKSDLKLVGLIISIVNKKKTKIDFQGSSARSKDKIGCHHGRIEAEAEAMLCDHV